MMGLCFKSVEGMIKMGEGFTEVQSEMYATSRYVPFKAEWIKWKRMLAKVSVSDMKLDTLLNLVFYRIFNENGLWDQAYAYEKAELENLNKTVNAIKFWDFNMKMPEGCNNMTCDHIKSWVGVRGVSANAASMMNFRIADAKNITLRDVDFNLDVYKKYEDEITKNSTLEEIATYEKAILAALEGNMTLLENLMNGTDPFKPKPA